MTTSGNAPSEKSIEQERAKEMAKYQISLVPVDYFHYRNYRYTNLVDAIAQAKRNTDKAGGKAITPT